MAVISDLLFIYLKQFFHICDGVTDFVSFYSFTNISNSLNGTGNETIKELSEDIASYGNVTLGITWLPGLIYFLIFISMGFEQKSKITKSTSIQLAIVSVLLAPIAPLSIGIAMILSKNRHDKSNLVNLFGLVEASLEASVQVIWQGYIICEKLLPKENDIVIVDSDGNRFQIAQQYISYVTILSSIFVLCFSSLSSFIEFRKVRNHIADVILIITSQTFRTVSFILVLTYTPFGNLFMCLLIIAIFVCNVYLLKEEKMFVDSTLLLIINSTLNVPMICFYNEKKFSIANDENESNDNNNDDDKPQQLHEDKINIKDVNKRMIKWTNLILVIFIIATVILVNFGGLQNLDRKLFTKDGNKFFNLVRYLIHGFIISAHL